MIVRPPTRCSFVLNRFPFDRQKDSYSPFFFFYLYSYPATVDSIPALYLLVILPLSLCVLSIVGDFHTRHEDGMDA